MWKSVRGGSYYWCKKLKVIKFNEEEQNKEKYPSFYDLIKVFSNQWPYNKNNLAQHVFFENLVLYILKVTICCPLLRIHN